MRDVLRFEFLRWVRTRRMLVLGVAFVFSALTGPLMTAYAENIVGALQTSNNLQILFEIPTWIDGGTSYLQNAAQVSLLFACFLAARSCALGESDRLSIHYRIRARTRRHLFGPRLFMSVFVTWLTAMIGLALATYQIGVLFDDVEYDRLVQAFLAQSLGIAMVAFLAGALAARTNAPGTSALVVYFAVFIADLLRDASWIRGYSPTALLRPTDLLETASLSDYAGPALAAVAVIVVGSFLSLRSRIRETHQTLELSRRVSTECLPCPRRSSPPTSFESDLYTHK